MLAKQLGCQCSVIQESITSPAPLPRPFTPSGKIVVNGIVASTFTDVNWPFVSGQWVVHTFEAPHRWVASHFNWFGRVETHAANGMLSNWVAGAAQVSSWIQKQHVLAVSGIFIHCLGCNLTHRHVVPQK